jgi:hypothetical protein
MSGLNITHVHRNLHTRLTFLYLEFEDAFVILGIAALLEQNGGSVNGTDHLIGWLPGYFTIRTRLS